MQYTHVYQLSQSDPSHIKLQTHLHTQFVTDYLGFSGFPCLGRVHIMLG